MKNFLAFKYTTDLSRELDGTGIKIDGEIRVEMVERSTAYVIAEDFKREPSVNRIGLLQNVKSVRRKFTSSDVSILGECLANPPDASWRGSPSTAL
jgi:hypothetical protein